jgi:hypothetical protein
MKKEKQSRGTPPVLHSTTPEGMEQELISMAYQAAGERIANGTASSQEIVHFLKLGSRRERLEEEKLLRDIDLQETKKSAIEETGKLEELYLNAINAMKRYQGVDDAK